MITLEEKEILINLKVEQFIVENGLVKREMVEEFKNGLMELNMMVRRNIFKIFI